MKRVLWLKDSGALQMPPPVHQVFHEGQVSGDKLDGTLGAIVASGMRGRPPSPEYDSGSMAADVNMQGNTSDLGTATQDFSKAIMQYMGTEYEAIFSGGWRMMEEPYGGDRSRGLVEFNHEGQLALPGIERIDGVWRNEKSGK